MSNQICGYDYDVVPPTIEHAVDKHKASSRIHVKGINKANGEPVRFKSQERAFHHIQNMRLER